MLHSMTHISILMKKIEEEPLKAEFLLENEVLCCFLDLLFPKEASGQDVGRASCRLSWSHHNKVGDQGKRVKIFNGARSNYRPRFGPGSSINISLNVFC